VPALPFCVLTDWAQGVEAPACPPDQLGSALERDRTRLRTRLTDLVQRPEVALALSVASPDLLDAVRDRSDDPGVEAALVRYLSRMASRPTPFGLFAACGVGQIADRTHISVPDPMSWRRHTRLDGDYLDRVVTSRAMALRPQMRFRPNDSLYAVAGRRRYVQTRFDGLERTHHLAEVPETAHLTRALTAAKTGATPASIAAAVTSGGVEPPQAAAYVDALIEAQVLRPTLGMTITGPAPLDALLADLGDLGDTGTTAVLGAVRDELAAMDVPGGSGDPERHQRVARMLGELAVPDGRARLVQVDSTIPPCDATLARATVDDVVRAVELLRRIAPVPEPTDLDRFRAAFEERYGEREVPLLEALDDDLGAGYGSGRRGGDPAPLLKGLARPVPDRQVTMGRREDRLLDLLHRCWATGAREVTLSRDDITAMARDEAAELPGALGAMATIARTVDGPRVVVSLAGGPTGVALLGRFCHADPVLETQVRAHLRAEEALDPDAIHAEIVHLPSGLTANILVRPVLREWELEWLGRSGAPVGRRLPVADLVVSIRNGRFVLRSRLLGRRVLPRLTSAHNWRQRSPAVYRFLSAVQSEGTVAGVSWTWAPFTRLPFTPRVRWGAIVLALAAWSVSSSELRALDDRDAVVRWQAVQAWRDRRRLPRWVCLVDGDNKLAIDLDNVLSVDAFVRTTRSRDQALLEELYPAPDELIAEGPDGRRVLELVIPLVRTTPPASIPSAAAPVAEVRRTFPPGSEWTYLKLYTGTATADSLLRQSIGPLARDLLASGAADRWFFIRYADPRFHLRLRFHGDPQALAGPVEALAARALDRGLAYDAQLGTYEPEVERYHGPHGLDVAERIFHADSDAVIDLLGMFARGEPGLGERWRIGLFGADALLRDLGLDLDDRAEFARRRQRAFEQEFSADARLRQAVAARVRSERDGCDALLSATSDTDHPLASGIAVIEQRSRRIEPLAAELAARSTGGRHGDAAAILAESYVHMWLDRLHRSENRFHEYVTYALLARVLQARAKRAQA
jgi:thiopeptide-type bacteriocin biosynthesis protein